MKYLYDWHFENGIFKRIFINENVTIFIEIPLTYISATRPR